MAIPDFQTLMPPSLENLAGGDVRRVVPDITDAQASRFNLSLEDRDQLLPSGAMPTFVNRTHWVATYLTKAGLVERPTSGHLRITDRSIAILATKPPRNDILFLRRFPGFEEFRTRTKRAAETSGVASVDDGIDGVIDEDKLGLTPCTSRRRGTPRRTAWAIRRLRRSPGA